MQVEREDEDVRTLGRWTVYHHSPATLAFRIALTLDQNENPNPSLLRMSDFLKQHMPRGGKISALRRYRIKINQRYKTEVIIAFLREEDRLLFLLKFGDA